jgi:hypothetical protein
LALDGKGCSKGFVAFACFLSTSNESLQSGSSFYFFTCLERNENELTPAAFFAVGKALNGNINFHSKLIFNDDYHFSQRIGMANRAVYFFGQQIHACRRAVFTWTKVGIRWKVVKDIRILIAKMIWAAREEAKYIV